MLTPASSIAILGFGDDCRRIVAALAPRGCALRVFDPRIGHASDNSLLRAQIEALGVDVAPDTAGAVRAARLVVLDGGFPAAPVGVPPVAGQVLLDMRAATDAAAEGDDAEHGMRLTGWFDARALRIAGTRAPALAAALTAIGLNSEAAAAGDRTGAHPAPSATAPTSNTPPLVRRGELP